MKNYLIVGASDGIGLSVAEILSENSNVYGTYFSAAQSKLSNTINYFPFDVMKDEMDLTLLPDVLDGIVYCPGAIDLKPMQRINEDEILDDFRLQVLGAFNTVKAVLPLLKKAKQASVLFISTVAVQKGFTFHSKVAMSKGALEGLTRSLAAEFAPGIRVNCVAPSLTNTKLAGRLLNTPEKIEAHGKTHPLGRVGEAKDVAETIAFLLDERASWISGQIIHVDGGKSTLN